MIFSAEMAKLIAGGRKSQTRRPVKEGESACRYKAGRVYGIQHGRGKSSSGVLTITGEPRIERLIEISLRDVKREGFHTTEEFRAHWEQLHGSWNPELPVWVISFAKGDQTDKPRLLAARPGGSQGDYTDNPSRAVRGEGEAVSLAVQERYAKDASERDSVLRQAMRARLGASVGEVRRGAEAIPRSQLGPAARKKLKSALHHLADVERDLLDEPPASVLF